MEKGSVRLSSPMKRSGHMLELPLSYEEWEGLQEKVCSFAALGYGLVDVEDLVVMLLTSAVDDMLDFGGSDESRLMDEWFSAKYGI